MTKKQSNGSQDHTLQSQVNPKVFEVVTLLNSKLKSMKKRGLGHISLRPITPEEMRWIQKYVETGDIIAASYYAYGDKINNKVHARNMGLVKMDKPIIRTAIGDIMTQDERLSEDKVIKRFGDLMYSENEVVASGMVKEYFKIKGAYAPEKHIGINANADISSFTDEDFVSETLKSLGERDERGEEDILDQITLRDGEETGEAGL